MRQLLVAAAVVLSIGTAQAFADEAVEIKGPHICCGACVKAVQSILGKVEGIADVKCSTKDKTINFTAKDKKAAEAALGAIFDGGFAGTAKIGDASISRATAKVEGKANDITVKGIHACCGQCHNALKALFPDAKVTFEGTGPQRTMTIVGTDLSLSAVVQALNKEGFSGKVEKAGK